MTRLAINAVKLSLGRMVFAPVLAPPIIGKSARTCRQNRVITP
jgi:hypothetical protein